MAKKFINYLMWGGLIASIGGVLWFLIAPLLNNEEIIFYLRLFLCMFALNTFAVLRLYNSIVQNTRFSIKLMESIIKFTNSIPNLERALKNFSGTMSNAKGSIDSLNRGLTNNSEKIEELTNKINKLK